MATTSAGTGTKFTFTAAERSRSAATPRPADCRVTSIWRFFMSSTDSPKGRYSTLEKSEYDSPAALRMARALISVPERGAPTEMRLPLRSASVFTLASASATIWM